MLSMRRWRPAILAVALAVLATAGAQAPAWAAPDAPADSAADGEDSASVTSAMPDEPPRKKKKKKKRKKRRAGWHLGVESSAVARGGALQGEGTRTGSAAVLRVDVDAQAEVERGVWRLRVPIDARHRETLGASFDETRGGTGVELRYRRGPELRVSVEAKLSAVWRPDWPDPYQPIAAGGYQPTDRNSHWDRALGATLAAIPLRHQHARVRYAYDLVDYREDPNFDALDAPNHLVPSDHAQHTVDMSWRYFGRGWKAGVAADLFAKEYFYVFARDALTGRTHAGAGGAPPNPLQRFRGIEPALTFEHELRGGALEIDLSYGYEIQDDTFAGYYSYTGHHPEAGLTWAVRPGHELSAKGALRWRTYGPNSYAEGPTHPALTYGDRRVDRRGSLSLGYRMALGRGWTAVADGDLLVRRTNFPPYEPGVFPASRAYDIDWNYESWTLLAGIEHRR